ncbi:MAG: MBL fold metallo-hydrolase [Pedosphaera sp.]|nr:MBL fold metallo-hydrolase [Pedosphaera sp.]
MIEPVLNDAAFLTDVDRARSDVQHLHLWWLGQSGFLIQWQERHLLIDPYLSDSLTKKYANTDKPHVRMTSRPVSPESLNFIDVVTSSHNHTDHLDAETLRPLLRVNPKLEMILPEANREFVTNRLGIETDMPVGLNRGESAHVASFNFTAVPSAHENIEVDSLGRCHYLGYVIEFGPWTLYHSGDTVRYEGMAELLRRWQIDVALLPINGRAVERRVAGNLSGPEAATLAKDIGARLIIPCHYEMFEFNTASPEEFVRTAQTLQQPYRILRCAERWSSAELL